MDTLTGEWHRSYRIDLHLKGVPFVRQITENESFLAIKLPVPAALKRNHVTQQLVFNF